MTRESALDVSLDVDDRLSLPAAVEVAIYRSATEAVTNVVRHSTAEHCRLTVAEKSGEVVFTVDDDGGVGGTWQAGVGLVSMRERAAELGGTFSASSGPNGFHIKATYPRS